MKTIFTHKTKGTQLTLISTIDSKKSLVLDSEGNELEIATITLTRWYDVEEVEDQEVVVEDQEVKDQEVKSSKSAKAKTITLNEVYDVAHFSLSTKVEDEDQTLNFSIINYYHGKSLRTEAVIKTATEVYRFGSVFNPDTFKVISSYYLVNDSKDGLESIQRKGIKTAAPVLAEKLEISQSLVESVLCLTRKHAQE